MRKNSHIYDFLNINFGEEATKALAGFYARPLSRLNWNSVMLVFQ